MSSWSVTLAMPPTLYCGKNLVWSLYITPSWALTLNWVVLGLVSCRTPTTVSSRFSCSFSWSSPPCLLTHIFSQWWAFSKALFTILSDCPAHTILSLRTSHGGNRHNAKIGTRLLIGSRSRIYSLPFSLTLKSLCSFYHFCLLRFHHPLKLTFFPFPVSGIL